MADGDSKQEFSDYLFEELEEHLIRRLKDCFPDHFYIGWSGKVLDGKSIVNVRVGDTETFYHVLKIEIPIKDFIREMVETIEDEDEFTLFVKELRSVVTNLESP